MNQDFLNWQETIHMLPLSDGVCTGKGRGWWRLADLACPDKNIVWWALLSVFRAWDGHSSTPVRPPWQWLALSSSFPGPLSRWPASWKCQRWVAVLPHIIALWPLLSSVLFISRKSILPKFVRLSYVPLRRLWVMKNRRASPCVFWPEQKWWYRWRNFFWDTGIGMAIIWSF